jgi:hypothetical protein
MKEIGNHADHSARWRPKLTIEKYNSPESYQAFLDGVGQADDILVTEGNLLLNVGVNHLWKLVAGLADAAEDPFNAVNSHIGVGDNNGNTAQPIPADTKLAAIDNFVYMGMDGGDDPYPHAGHNQKIVFRSTFLPGIACFEWLEWGISNSNGNPTNFNQHQMRTTQIGSDPLPDPVPSVGYSIFQGNSQGEDGPFILLNRKQENMGRKYASATWIVTCEISLS